MPLEIGALPLPDIELVRHKSIRSILSQFWRLKEEGLTWEEFLKCESEGLADNGERVTFTPETEVAGIRRMGFWGYAETKAKPRRIHVWIGKRADPEAVRFFLGHEIGHCLGRPSRDHFAEENRADTYGQAAALSAKWLGELTGA